MTYADEVARVALGVMSDPNFVQQATLYVDTSPEDSYYNKTAITHTTVTLNGFFSKNPARKAIEAEGTEPQATAVFYTHDVTTTIRLKDNLAYGGEVYEIISVSTPQAAGKKMYRILGLEISEAAV